MNPVSKILTLVLVIALLGVGVWWGVGQQKNDNSVPKKNTSSQVNLNSDLLNSNQVANINVSENRNQNINAATKKASFGALVFTYQASWTSEPYSISGVSCVKLSSPERQQFIQNLLNSNPSATMTDAFVGYDVLLCDRGALQTSFEAALTVWKNDNRDSILDEKNNSPFEDATTFVLGGVSQTTKIFFQIAGHLVSADYETIPQKTETEVLRVLQSVAAE